MTTKQTIDTFLNLQNIAVVGVSQNPKKFGTLCYHFLRENDYNIIPVNNKLSEFDDRKCYPNLTSIPEKIDGALLVVPGEQTEKVVEEAKSLGINYIWMQTGSETKKAIEFCENNNINVVHNECIFMFAEPVKGAHKFHRVIKKIFRKLPA